MKQKEEEFNKQLQQKDGELQKEEELSKQLQQKDEEIKQKDLELQQKEEEFSKQLQQKDDEIKQKEEEIKQKNLVLQQKEEEFSQKLQQKDDELEEKNKEIKQKDGELKEMEKKLKKKGKSLAELSVEPEKISDSEQSDITSDSTKAMTQTLPASLRPSKPNQKSTVYDHYQDDVLARSQKGEKLESSSQSNPRFSAQHLNDSDYLKGELAKAQTIISEKRKELEDTRSQLEGTENELIETKKELERAEKELKATQEELSNTREELESAEEKHINAVKKLSDTEQELSQSRKDLSAALTQYQSARKSIIELKASAVVDTRKKVPRAESKLKVPDLIQQCVTDKDEIRSVMRLGEIKDIAEMEDLVVALFVKFVEEHHKYVSAKGISVEGKKRQTKYGTGHLRQGRQT